MQPLSHGDGHLDAGEGVVLDAPRLRITEECDDGVSDVLVDGLKHCAGA